MFSRSGLDYKSVLLTFSLLLNVYFMIRFFSHSGLYYATFVHADFVTNRELSQIVPSRNIFIDLGANNGKSISLCVEKKHSVGKDGHGDTGGLEGLCEDKNWEIVAFEANPMFSKDLMDLKDFYEKSKAVRKFHIFNETAIGVETGSTILALDDNELGLSSSVEPRSAVMRGFNGWGSRRIKINMIGISDLFASLDIHKDDFVVLKVDIEGAEFELLRRIVTHGLQSKIDVLAVEYHDNNPGFIAGMGEDSVKALGHKKECLKWMLDDIKHIKRVDWG